MTPSPAPRMPTAAEPFDLAVVGASFAGLACARAAALRGLKVCVIEAKVDAGARVHTTGIVVKEAGDELDIPARFTRPIYGCGSMRRRCARWTCSRRATTS